MLVFFSFKQSKFRISSSGGHQLEPLVSPSRRVKTQRQDGLRNPPDIGITKSGEHVRTRRPSAADLANCHLNRRVYGGRRPYLVAAQ